MLVAMIALVAVCITFLSVFGSRGYNSYGPGQIAIPILGPIQKSVTGSIRFFRDIWHQYFSLVSTTKENQRLKRELNQYIARLNQCNEIELANKRLRKFLNFKKEIKNELLAAEVIAKDPSTWFKTIVIDKGSLQGIQEGMPVVIPEGIAGVVSDVSGNYSRVLLIIDQNSAVDALVQRTRIRGVIKGLMNEMCSFKYVLRKNEIRKEDVVVSSGLDGIFPKGLRIGKIDKVDEQNTPGIFHNVTLTPFVDFEKLEEVFVILNPPKYQFSSER